MVVSNFGRQCALFERNARPSGYRSPWTGETANGRNLVGKQPGGQYYACTKTVSPVQMTSSLSFRQVPAVLDAAAKVGKVALGGKVAIDVIGGIGSIADLVCRYFPNVCNVGVPGAPYPTPSPGTPAPIPPSTPITGNFQPFGGVCPSGYHWNKTGYMTTQGYVEKGTRCVKNRRMNPTNPRALARAIRRGDSFVRLAKSFGLKAPERGLKKSRCRR